MTLNVQVEDVDGVHCRLTCAGLVPVMLLEDHPCGDRGFSVVNPAGVSFYVYLVREPSPDFKAYYR